MLDQFSRTRLVIGGEGLARLAAARVVVFGLGGVGGSCAEALARAGVGALDVVDDDYVCLTNINRQAFATYATIGQPKVEAAAARIRDVNPDCAVREHRCFFLPETAGEFDFSAYDYVVDAVDTVSAKLSLVETCHAAGTPIISAMGAGNKLDPTAFRVADIYDTRVCPLAKVMRKELRRRGIPALKVVYSEEMPVLPPESAENSCRFGCVCPPEATRHCTDRRSVPGSVSFVPPVVGLVAAGEVVRDLLGVGR